MDRRLSDYVPPWASEVLELTAFFGAVEAELHHAWDTARALYEGQFAMSADGAELLRWENLLGLSHLGSTPARRARVALRLAERRPYTLSRLRGAIAVLTGDSGARLTVDGHTLRAQVGSEDSLPEIRTLLARCAPAIFTLDVTRKLAEHQELNTLPHTKLAGYTHEEIRNEVATSGN